MEWAELRKRLEGPPAYGSWRSMHDRCGNPEHASFHNYGGRGIGVCNRWFSIGKMKEPPGAES